MKDGNKVKQVKECTNLEKYKRENAQWVGRLKHIQKKSIQRHRHKTTT